MKLGYIGLGKMGLNMAVRLVKRGHEVIGYDTSPEHKSAAEAGGVKTVATLVDLVAEQSSPRLIWLMVPHEVVDSVLAELLPNLLASDVIIDGGNSHWEKTLVHAKRCETIHVGFMDVGTSGGPPGARNGACLMIGGSTELFARYEPLFESIAAESAYKHVGPVGAGHFVKMVHNGVEYGMMQSIADGIEVLRASPFKVDLIDVFDIYNNKSVIESRLVGWMLAGFKNYGTELEGITSTVGSTGEGQWMVDTARKFKVPVPVIEAAVEFRRQSADRPSFAGKALSAMRNMFGGHSIGKQ